MLCDAPPNVDFLAWYETLSDEDQCDIYNELERIAKELGCGIDKKTLVSHDFLDLGPNLFAVPSLN